MAEPPVIHVLQVTDPHLFADRAAEIYGVRTFDSFRAVLAAALASPMHAPDAVIVTGDIGDDLTEAAYRNFLDAMQGVTAPVYCIAGNHDDPARMAMRLVGSRMQFGGRTILGGWGLVFVDSHIDGEPDGIVTPAEFARLERDLGELADRPAMVCIHHPPFRVGSAWLDGLGLRNGPEVLGLLRRFPGVRAVLSGHVHQAFDAVQDGLRLLSTPSTCAQFTARTERAVIDTRPPGWRWLHLHPDGRIETEVHWLEGWEVAAPPPDSRAGEALGMPA
jgi:Icc protein